MSWQQECLDNAGQNVTGMVFRNADYGLVDSEFEKTKFHANADCSVFVRQPALSRVNPIGVTASGHFIYKPPLPMKEVWRLDGIGPFAAVKICKESFNAPGEDALLDSGVSIDNLVAGLAEIFGPTDLALSFVTESFLVFDLLPRGSKMTRSQYQAIDRINRECFRADEMGRRVPAARRCRPEAFVVGLF
ncbi:MAG: hypothetical protein KA788_13740 [Lacunisphaera sp.]|nr:hypothetical protein [Lacunisphaera sp.]